MFEPRDYQINEKKLLRKAMADGCKRIMSVGPPGVGKGSLIAWHAVEAARRGLRVLIFMHKSDLVRQQAKRIIKQFGYRDVGFIMSGMPRAQKPIMVGTVQTMVRRNIPQNFDLIFVDECHRIKTNQHQSIVEQFPDAYLVGYTATPFRSDKKGFKDDFDKLIQCTTYNEMVSKKYLVPTRVVEPDMPIDFSGVKLSISDGGKDFDDKEQEALLDDERVYRQIVEKWLQWGKGKKTIAFTINRKTYCEKLAWWFKEYGIDARYVTADTPKDERIRTLSDFEKGEFPVLVNIAIFSEGISIDDVSCIIDAFATLSMTKWVQTNTRASRPVWNADYSDWLRSPDGNYVKDHCLIIDFGGNRQRHGKVDDYDLFPFDLSGTPPKTQEAKTKDCPECGEVVFVQTRKCPKCGYVFPIKEKDEIEIYADEVEWKITDRVMALRQKVSTESLSYAQMKRWLETKPCGHLLRLIAEARGWGRDWPVYTAIRYNFTDKTDPKEDRDAIIEQLRAFEKEKGIYEVVEKLLNQ